MNYSLLIKGYEGDINEIAIEECLLTHKRKRKVVIAAE